ncbi:MAG: heme-dependent oxidative N-demethylase subunit alpha family protein, partial [Acidimicrobiales bacterium]
PTFVEELPLDGPWPAMGVHADDRTWPAPAPAELLTLRARLVDERRDDVLGIMPRAEPAAAETAALVGASDLADAAGHCADDLCLLAPEPGHPLLAGLVCFPSHWRLADKLGRPLADVHGRVPHFADSLANRVDTFLHRLRVGQLMWRRNLLFHRDGELHAPVSSAADVPPERWWLRSERQTFRRLPATGWVLFTIRTDQVALADLDVATRRRLATRLRELPPEWAPYAGVTPALAEWLERRPP